MIMIFLFDGPLEISFLISAIKITNQLSRSILFAHFHIIQSMFFLVVKGMPFETIVITWRHKDDDCINTVVIIHKDDDCINTVVIIHKDDDGINTVVIIHKDDDCINTMVIIMFLTVIIIIINGVGFV